MTTAVLLAAAPACGLWAAFGVRLGLVAARMYQIEEYQAPRFLAWALQRAWLAGRSTVTASLFMAVVVVVVVVVAAFGNEAWPPAIPVAWGAAGAVAQSQWSWMSPKKVLVFTARMRRLLAVASVAGLIGLLLPVLAMMLLPPWAGALAALLFTATLPIVVILIGLLAGTLLRPVEARINARYVRAARRRMNEWKPMVMAVSGSYGKTSTKHIIWGLLEAQTATLATPKSFNTLMGVTRTINENLEARDRIFIVEMDAYAPGEIAAICRLTPPQLAVVTSVGPQHLERFGTIDRIGDALYETIEPLAPDHPAVVYCGDALSAALADRAAGDGHRVVRYGMDGDVARLDVAAADVHTDADGTHFTWRWDAEDLHIPVTIPLLGAHNVLNTAAALAVVRLLGYNVDAAAALCARLEPVPHRLQIVPTTNAIRVIDDSYNANPVGVHNGLDVLAGFDGRKILVTPGMVELGSVEDAENRRYGEHAARVCDDVIVMVSQPAQAVLAGLQSGGMAAEHIHEVRSLDEATAIIGTIAKLGDTVLFANDLPDTYL